MGDLSKINWEFSYRKGENDIAQEFYIPCMSMACSYDRAVGFFRSTVYLIAWPALKSFVQNGGKIRVVCSPMLSPDDVRAIGEGLDRKAEAKLEEDIRCEVIRMLGDPVLEKPARVLAGLIAADVLDIQIVFLGDDSESNVRKIFHDKLGIFRDEFGNAVAFKGSMNESFNGLSVDGNLESIDVFVNWENRERERIAKESQFFDQLWAGQYNPTNVHVKPFSEIAKDELVRALEGKNWEQLVDELCDKLVREPELPRPNPGGHKSPKHHQKDALEKWYERGRRGILDHATGSGKTLTAIFAIKDAIERSETAIVLVPSDLLLEQWEKELKKECDDLGLSVLTCGAGSDGWKKDGLLGAWTSPGRKGRVVISTIQTARSEEFLRSIRQGDHIFLLADEAHRLGSPINSKILSLRSGPRLGLSATPRRAMDPEGTAALFDYFSGVIESPFTLRDGIRTGTLTPYWYYPHPVMLTANEQERWNKLTQRAIILHSKDQRAKVKDPSMPGKIKDLLIERAKVIKGASQKIPLAVDILLKNFQLGEKWLVYCDSQAQLSTLREALFKSGLEAAEYHSAMAGDKEETLRYFGENGGILLSIKCLDEGVDIPSVTHALILASSKNPREFIQRRGRVLRLAPGKMFAFIHDAVVVPISVGEDLQGAAFLEGELARAIEFGKDARNPTAITDLQKIAASIGLDYSKLLEEGYEDEE